MQPTLVCLGAGKSQLLVIRKAKELGFLIIAIDRNPSAPGFLLSDVQLELSTHEAEPIICALKKLISKFKIVGVINRSAGPPVITAATICTAFSLPGVTIETAQTVVDKGRLMRFCQLNDIPAPLCQSVSTLRDLNAEDLTFPCIIKPALSLIGKGGVRLVKKSSDLPSAFNEAAQKTFNQRINVEQCIPGDDVSFISFVHQGELHPLVLLDEINGIDAEGNHFGQGFSVPSRHWKKETGDAVIRAARQLSDALNLKTTVFLVSFRVTPNTAPKVIEIHLDMGGDRILDDLMPASTNFDFVSFFINGLAGKFSQQDDIYFSPTAVMFDYGNQLISNKDFSIIKDESISSLWKKINNNLSMNNP